MSIYEQAQKCAQELIEKSGIKEGQTVVIGCSTSEVLGEKIGTSGSLDTALELYNGLNDVFKAKGINLAAQCCEHLNRAIIVERETAEKLGCEIVCVVPQIHAGGSFATTAYREMKDPVAVEEIKADAGIDIGNTMIGMHLKRVAVPLRFQNNRIGEAAVNGARTRPKYIGGERAKYE